MHATTRRRRATPRPSQQKLLRRSRPVEPRGPRSAAIALLVCVARSAPALAAGPENLALIVNSDDPVSLRVANEYVRLRAIPPVNVVYLSGVPRAHVIPVEDLREKILRPLFGTLQERGLAGQIDCVAYSAGFPYAVNVAGDLKGVTLRRYQTQPASITGLTYLYQFVLAKRPDLYMSLTSNGYMRTPLPGEDGEPWTEDERKLLAETVEIFRRLIELRRSAGKEGEGGPDPAAEEGRRELLAAVLPMLEKLLETHPGNASCHYNRACVLAMQGAGDAAMAALHRAVEAGWWNVDHTLGDQDLESLRGRADFTELIAEVRRAVFRVRPTLAFQNAYGFTGRGQVVPPDQGVCYMLCTMLAHVGPKSNTLAEALRCLGRAAAADGTRPGGTVYFMKNDNVRSKARAWAFHAAAETLKEEGIRAEILEGQLPKGRPDVAGLVVGAANFDWSSCGSAILPGAISEHLTSAGGVMKGGGQTLLSEWIRHGAAGSSGTVTEPYSIPHKFPSAFMHVHYARGATLAEAFYQSVHGPYQLLIVGDALCRPWSRKFEVASGGILPGQTLSGTVSVVPTARGEGAGNVRGFHLYLDGVRRQAVENGGTFEIDTVALGDGWHELRIVAVASLEATGRLLVPFRVRNRSREVSIVEAPRGEVRGAGPIRIEARLSGASRIDILHNARTVGTIDGASGVAEIAPPRLGGGPVRLQAVGRLADGRQTPVYSEFIEFTIADE